MRVVCLAVVLGVFTALPAAAQSNVEVNAGVQFDFLSPGARSMAMGSAFIGVADDATAAVTNPAGLRALSRREVAFEGRGRNFEIPVAARGHFAGAPSGRGTDTIPLEIQDQSQSGGGLSFLSFVLPRTRWAIAGYRHEVANFDTSVETQGPFYGQVDTASEGRRFPIRGTMDLGITTYGVSGSFNITPQFSVGAGLAFYDFSMESRTDRFFFDSGAGFYDAANFAANNVQNYQIQEGDDTNIGVNLGAIFAPSRAFQLGLVYRQGPDFDLRVANIDPTTNQPFPGADREGQFHVPHMFGVGALFRPMTNGTIAIDVSRIGYSRMTDDFVDLFANATTPDESALFSVDNATEVHLGFEYVFTSQTPVAVRGGYWFDPDHSLEYNGESLSRLSTFQGLGDDQHHVTAGAGAVFGRFEVNGAVDHASRATAFSVSAVVRF